MENELLPFDDKENFDQELFDSIEPPPKPASPLKATAIAVGLVVVMNVIASTCVGLDPDLDIFMFMTLLFGLPAALITFFVYGEKNDKWKANMSNLDQYKIDQYNILKAKHDKDNLFNQALQRYTDSAIHYHFHSLGFEAYYSIQKSPDRIELIKRYFRDDYYSVPFAEIIGVQILEDKEVRGGVGRAIIGGAIAGDAGAIVGATTAKNFVTSYNVRILTNNLASPSYDIPLISIKTEVNSSDYRNAVSFANNVQASIGAIVHRQQQASSNFQAVSVNDAITKPVDCADEIMKFKQLLDCGAITQEEFNEKKKQLLNL